MKRVLFVDDDQMILKLIERKMKSTDIKCHFAGSGKEALKWLKQFDINVMFTDIMMPDMNGLELAVKAQSISPNTMRIVLSGSTQVTAIVDAINEGHVYKYIVKPWKIDKEAIEMIEEAVNISKEWSAGDDVKSEKIIFVEASVLKKASLLGSWVLTDDNLSVIESSFDGGLPVDWRDQPYELINGSDGVLRLYNLDMGRK